MTAYDRHIRRLMLDLCTPEEIDLYFAIICATELADLDLSGNDLLEWEVN